MFNKVNANVYESDNGYVVEFQRIDGEKAALVGKNRDNGTTRLLFIISVEDISRKEALTHIEENLDEYLEKYVK